jgi:hypothetical protein
MNTKFLKFTVLGAFFSLAIFGFFISGSHITAQKKKSDILEKAAGYKSWKQPIKPIQNRPLEPLVKAPDAITINTSSGFG